MKKPIMRSPTDYLSIFQHFPTDGIVVKLSEYLQKFFVCLFFQISHLFGVSSQLKACFIVQKSRLMMERTKTNKLSCLFSFAMNCRDSLCGDLFRLHKLKQKLHLPTRFRNVLLHTQQQQRWQLQDL